MSVADDLGREDRLIGGIEPVAVAADPFLGALDLPGGQAGRGQRRPPGPLPDANDDIAAVQVVIIVGEGADRPQRLEPRRMRVPGRLEFHPLRLHAAAVEEVVEVDRKN